MQEQTPIDFSRKWYVMSAVAMSIFLATIDGSIVNVALPTLVRDLETNFPTVQWVVLAYLLTQVTLLLSIGRLGDMIGKKLIYTAGFVVFTIGSVLCGLSPSVYWLIGFRVLQAVGAAMVIALGTAIVTEAFPPAERGKAMGVIGAVVSIGIVIGPTAGGILINALSWRWIFFVNLPVGIIGTFMAHRFVPEILPVGRQRFDYWGAFTLFISLISLLLALTVGQQVGFSQPLIIALFVNWVIFLVIFIGVELKTKEPMIDFRLFQNSLFSINLITGMLSFVAIAGVFILMPFYLEEVLGYDTRQVGYLLSIIPIALGMTSPISGRLSDRFGPRPIIVIGLLLCVIGYVAASTLTLETRALGYILRLLPLGIGMGIFQSPNNSAIMGSVPKAHLGVASGLLAITRTLGQTVGIAILGALWAARVIAYHGAPLVDGATTAPAQAQVTGLQETFRSVIILMLIALLLSIWALRQEKRSQPRPTPVPEAR